MYNDGTINWIPPGIVRISCKLDIKWFPFDEQKCWMKFGSWSFDGTKIDLQPLTSEGFDMSEYMINGEWVIASKEDYYMNLLFIANVSQKRRCFVRRSSTNVVQVEY